MTLSPQTKATEEHTRSQIQFHWSVFAFVWGLSCLADRLKRGVYEDPTSLLFVVAGVLLLLKPASFRRFLVLAVAQLAWFATTWSGEVMVHWYITATLHAAVLVVTSDYALRHRTLPKSPFPLWRSLVRTGQAVAAAGFFFAGFAKLNQDFLDPRTSCGGIYYLWFREIPGLGVLPTSMNARQVAAVLAAFFETLGPLALLWPRTRRAGILMCWSVLIALAINPRSHYFEFAGLFFSASLLFLPLGSLEVARSRFWTRLERLRVPSRLSKQQGNGKAWWVPALFAAGLVLSRGLLERPAVLLEGYRVLWLGIAIGLATHLGWRWKDLIQPPLARASWAAWVIPTLFLLNEVSPYVGLVHRPVLTMAANSAFYPQSSNHVLVNPIPTLPWTRDVLILESNQQALSPGRHMPWILFKDLMHSHPQAEVRFTVDGGSPSSSVAGTDPRFETGSIWPELLRLKPYVLPVGPNVCAKPPPGLSRKKWNKRRRKIAERVSVDRAGTEPSPGTMTR